MVVIENILNMVQILEKRLAFVESKLGIRAVKMKDVEPEEGIPCKCGALEYPRSERREGN